MTPEERARALVRGKDYMDEVYHTNEDGEEIPACVINDGRLERLVAAAILAAVAEEREACAQVCDKLEEQASSDSYYTIEEARGGSVALQVAAAAIRDRGKQQEGT